MLEYLNLLPGDLSPFDAAQQFLSLSAEHAAANDLNPAVILMLIHDLLP